MNLHSFREYIKYQWSAKTRHGIHSPFVYAFVDNCLGKQSNLNLEQRINAYFGDKIIWVDDDMQFDNSNQLTVFAIKNIHATKENTERWNELSSSPQFVVSIDVFSIGLLVYNPEIKEKQHFVLKYPL